MIPKLSASSKVLIYGYGHFGKHLCALFGDKVSGLNVRTYDLDRASVPPNIYARLDTIPDFDVVILSVPIRAYEEAIKCVVPLLRKDAILVDVASVKVHTTQLLKKYASHCFWISTHPMWGPESYRKTQGDVNGYRLVVTESTLPQSVYSSLAQLVKASGIEVVRMTSKHHDGHLSKTLFLTHFIGQVISFAGFTRTEIDTVSFGYLMNAVESVSGDAALFLDVYKYNPTACSNVLARLDDATHQVRLMIEGVRKT